MKFLALLSRQFYISENDHRQGPQVVCESDDFSDNNFPLIQTINCVATIYSTVQDYTKNMR